MTKPYIPRTRDGTTIVTSSYDNQIRTFLVPEDLLDARDQPLTLRPRRILQLAEPSNVVATSPYYDLRFPNTDHFLVACRDHPLKLYRALPPDGATPGDDDPQHEGHAAWELPIGSYPLISPTTEAYLPIHSLVWPAPGTHFLVGTRDLLAQFDLTRDGDGPVARLPTIPSRRHIRKGNGIGMRGTVSALAAQTTADDVPTGLVAAGTWTRRVGLYDMARAGECVSTWGVEDAAAGALATEPPPDAGPASPGATRVPLSVKGIGGAGINQTAWSPCGRYLVINERQSSGMLVYDVRVTNRLLGFLAGRDALTHQRLGCDVFRGLERVGGFEVWAGTRDGTVKVWEGVGNTEGCQWPSWDFAAADGHTAAGAPALGSVGLHHSGSVVATCSGCWTVPDDLGEEMDHSRESSPVSTDSDGDEPPSPVVCTSYGRHVRRPDNRRIEESTLKLWRIGPSTASNDGDAPGSDVLVGAASEEMSEIERYKLRVASALESIDTAEPEPTYASNPDT